MGEENVGNLGRRLSHLTEFVGDPFILAALLLGGVLTIAFSFSESKRWWLISAWVFCLSVSQFYNSLGNWIPPSFPFNHLVTYGRTIAVGMMIAMLPGAWVFYSRNPAGRTAPAAWALLFFYFVYCARYLPTVYIGQAIPRLMTYATIFFFLGMSMPRWITDARELRRALTAVGMSIVMIAGGSLVSYLMNPSSTLWNGRMFGLTSNPNFLGMSCGLVTPVILGLITWKNQTSLSKLFWVLVAGGVVITLLWTGSRGGMAVMVVGAAVFFRAKLGRLLFVAIPLALSVWAMTFLFQDSLQNIDRFTDLTDTRTAGWLRFIELWKESPILGNKNLAMAVIENSYLTILANSGILGAFAAFAFVYVWGTTCLKLVRMRPADPDSQILCDVAVAGLVAMLAETIFEAVLLANLNATTFYAFFFCALAEVALRPAVAAQPTYNHAMAARSY